jgi:transposase-like protein
MEHVKAVWYSPALTHTNFSWQPCQQEVCRGKQRRRFTREFKVKAVRLALAGDKPQKSVAADLGIKPEALYRWVKEFRGDPSQSFPGQGLMKA